MIPGAAAPGGALPPLVPPLEILRLQPEEADELLGALEAGVPVAPTLVEVPLVAKATALVFGDTHGDWRSSEAIAARFLARPNSSYLIGLGDYVDRAPDDCAEGSVANALYLLQLVARYPGRVLLVKGNHELHRLLPVLPHDLDTEVDELWGPDVRRYARLAGLLERGPLAVRTSSGAYLAHGGFPRVAKGVPVAAAFERLTEDQIVDIVWGESGASRSHRGVSAPFTERELKAYLAALGGTVFLRGHDPDLNGKAVFDNRCLTLHTSRIYERMGGVLFAQVPLDRPIRDLEDIGVEHLETEGKEFEAPA
ncbi:MAG: metallophosphoesterase [Thermoplasmata archaeon]|nr:metallophosphoesterase [Thermoplasmata archaeon]